MTQPDFYRDSPTRLSEAWRAAAEASKQQFPDDTKRYDYYMAEDEKLEKRA